VRTILVTGAAGFIGSHTAERLLARGDQVVGLDNLNDYYDPARKRNNIDEIRAVGGDRLTFVEGDIRDRELVGRLFAEHRFDGVAHLAAMAGVRVSVEDPALYYDVNQNGTLVLLDAVVGRIGGARRPGVNFVLASTSSVYGRTERLPFIETDNCDRPLAPYSASKRSAELLGHAYHHLYGVDFTALRFFTVYGPRGRPDMMAYKVLDSIRTGNAVPLYNGGQMHRDWTYVDDIVSGIVAAVDRPLGYEVINIGRGEPVLLADFVEVVQKIGGGRAKLVSEEMLDADVSYTYADASKAARLLDYAPTVGVEDGVRRFWEWYRGAVLEQD